MKFHINRQSKCHDEVSLRASWTTAFAFILSNNIPVEVKMKPKKSLRILTILLKASNLHTDQITVRGVKVPGWLFTVVHSTPMLWQLYLTYVFCKQINYDLGSVSGSLCVTCGIVQILAIYACLMQKKSHIVDSIGLLQDIVNERKCTHRTIFLL